MYYNKRLRPTVEGGMLAAVSIFFAIAGTMMPVLGAFINIVWPIPIIILGVRQGLKWSIWATVISGILIALVLNPVQAVITVVGMGLIGVVFGYAFHHNMGPAKTMLLGTIAALLSSMGVFLIGYLATGINPLNMQMESFDVTFSQMSELYRSMGVSEQEIDNLQRVGKIVMDLFKLAIPAMLLLSSVFAAWFNYVIAKIVLVKLGSRVESLPDFTTWLLPRYTSYFFFLGMALTYFGHEKGLELTYVMGLNILLTTAIALLVGGISLLLFFLQRFSLPRWLTGIICVVIIMNGVLAQIAVMLGAMDAMLDYRKLRNNETPQ